MKKAWNEPPYALVKNIFLQHLSNQMSCLLIPLPRNSHFVNMQAVFVFKNIGEKSRIPLSKNSRTGSKLSSPEQNIEQKNYPITGDEKDGTRNK